MEGINHVVIEVSDLKRAEEFPKPASIKPTVWRLGIARLSPETWRRAKSLFTVTKRIGPQKNGTIFIFMILMAIASSW